MIYTILKYIQYAVFSGLLYFIVIKRYKLLSFIKKIVYISLFGVIFILIIFMPFEVILFSFDTPEEAFYFSHNNQSIYKIIDSNECAFILSGSPNDSSKNECSIITKANGRWRMENPYTFLSVDYYTYKNVNISRIINENCNNQLIICQEIVSGNDDLVYIHDSVDSHFQIFEYYYPDMVYHVKYHYTIIDLNTERYTITIDSQNIQFKNDG